MSSSPVEDLARAAHVTGDLVAGVGDDQWGRPTPCTDWTVRDLVNHLVGGHLRFAAALSGEEPPPDAARRADHLGEDPAAAYLASAKTVLAAFRSPGAMERVIAVPIGSVPGSVALHLSLVEALVHGWDLAHATNQQFRADEEVAEQELQFTQAQLSRVPPGHSPFQPPQPVAEDAPAVDRLAGLLGHEVPTATT